jgi:uncharacterized protein
LLRLVIDTNVFIRYLIRPSTAVAALIERHWIEGQVQLVLSPELLAELTRVLARPSIQRLIHAEEAHALHTALQQQSELLAPLNQIPHYSRDPKDDMFVACALAGQVDYLVTFDEDLLSLGQVGNVQIVTPAQLVTQLNPL